MLPYEINKNQDILHPTRPPVKYWIHDEEKHEGGRQERGFGEVYVQVVELGGGYGEDGCGGCGGEDDADDDGGVIHEEGRKTIERDGENEEFHGEDGPKFSRVGPGAPEIEIIAHGHHAKPGIEMNKNVKDERERRRAADFHARKGEANEYAHHGELVPGEEHLPDLDFLPSPFPLMCPFVVVVGTQRECAEDDRENLWNGNHLDVGKAFLPIEDKGCKARRSPDVSEHHRNEVAPLFPGILETPLFKEKEDRRRDETDGNDGNREPQELGRDVDGPEGYDGKQKEHTHHIDPDHEAEVLPGKSPPFQKHAKGHGEQCINEYDGKS